MKRFLIILFSMIYLVTTAGISVNLHYCEDKLKDISFLGKDTEDGDDCHDEKEDTSCCDDYNSKICCNDKQATIKIQDNQFIGKCNYKFVKNTLANIPLFYFSLKDGYFTKIQPLDFSPAFSPSRNDLYIRYKSFLI